VGEGLLETIKLNCIRLIVNYKRIWHKVATQTWSCALRDSGRLVIALLCYKTWAVWNLAVDALDNAEKMFPHGLSADLPNAMGMPPLDPTALAKKLKLKRPALPTVPLFPLLKWQIDRKIRKQISFDLTDFLDLYAKQLRSWFRESVDALKKAFESAADMYRVQLQNGELPVCQDPLQTSADLNWLKANL
jgi:hypothetical protein